MDRKTRSGTRESLSPSNPRPPKKVRSNSARNVNANLEEDAPVIEVQNANTEEDVSVIEGVEKTSKERKNHKSFNHEGYTWHVNKSLNDGKTIYYDCSK